MSSGWISHAIGSFALDCQWNVSNGETLALFGQSGSGKSMTLQLLSGFLRPNNAYIEIAGEPIVDTSIGLYRPIYERDIGYVPQEYNLFPHFSVEKNISYGLFDWSTERKDFRVGELLEWLQIKDLRYRYPEGLSAGQKQRVAFARAIARKPKLLLLDEPFANLDESLTLLLRKKLQEEIIELGIPVIFVSHDWSDVRVLAHKVSILSNGSIVEQGLSGDISNPVTTSLKNTSQEGLVYCQGIVTHLHPQENLVRCTVNEGCILVEGIGNRIGQTLNLAINPRNIVLLLTRPESSMVENVLKGTIIGIRDAGSSNQLVIIDCGFELGAILSRQMAERYQIQVGQTTWALLRADDIKII